MGKKSGCEGSGLGEPLLARAGLGLGWTRAGNEELGVGGGGLRGCEEGTALGSKAAEMDPGGFC